MLLSLCTFPVLLDFLSLFCINCFWLYNGLQQGYSFQLLDFFIIHTNASSMTLSGKIEKNNPFTFAQKQFWKSIYTENKEALNPAQICSWIQKSERVIFYFFKEHNTNFYLLQKQLKSSVFHRGVYFSNLQCSEITC